MEREAAWGIKGVGQLGSAFLFTVQDIFKRYLVTHRKSERTEVVWSFQCSELKASASSPPLSASWALRSFVTNPRPSPHEKTRSVYGKNSNPRDYAARVR